jgi:hypothetical protein
MTDEPKPLTMQDLMEQNARLEKTVTGMAGIVDDILETVDRETGQLWEYALPKIQALLKEVDAIKTEMRK